MSVRLRDQSYEHTYPATFPEALGLTNGENHLSVSVSYDKGGTNYFSGHAEPRGYRLSLSAVKVEDGCVSFVVGGGLMKYGRRYFLAAAPRYNAKLLEKFNTAITARMAEIQTLALAADYDAIRAILTDCTATVQGRATVSA
jgi:hypothetical protein